MHDTTADVEGMQRELERLRAAAELREQRVLELEQERATLERLSEVAREIAAELDAQRLAQRVIDAATELTGAQLGALFYHLAGDLTGDRVEGDLRYATAGVPHEAFEGLALPRNTAILAPALLGHTTLRLADVTADPRYGKNHPQRGVPEGHPPIRSYLAVPLRSRSGEALGALLLGHLAADVFTERAERTATALAEYAAPAMDHARLHDQATRLGAELEEARAELDQLGDVVAHDLRTPLRGITDLATSVDEELPSTTDPVTKEQLRQLRRRAARMGRLVDGVLELTRVGRPRQEPERVDVTELLHETIEQLNPRESSRIMMIGELPMLVTDRTALEQVFEHLIGNALQHAGRDDVVVRISAIDRGEAWEIAIADNGVGIPREHHELVWQLFHTLPSQDELETTGIGLAIVRKQVERHGGDAWIDASPASGVTVRFTWPKRTR